MNAYMLMVMENEGAQKAAAPKDMAGLIERQAEFGKRLEARGALVERGRLRPSAEGKRVRRQGERIDVQTGPFTDDGRALGNYYWVEADSVEAAGALACECPTLAGDDVDVRPLMGGKPCHEANANATADTPGKVFAFSILGNSPSEKAWIETMDRIEAEGAQFPDDKFLGGMRLENPTKGRRVSDRGGHRAIFDGPFLESKEIIGGIFFMRMSSMDEAVSWASKQLCTVYGALEIRELWRS
jgi:hypothetical protein